MIAEMKALIEENKRLKRMYADSQMECEIIKEAMTKSGKACLPKGDGRVGCK